MGATLYNVALFRGNIVPWLLLLGLVVHFLFRNNILSVDPVMKKIDWFGFAFHILSWDIISMLENSLEQCDPILGP